MEDNKHLNQTDGAPEEQGTIEPFVPTDYFQDAPKKRLGRGGIVAICAGVLAYMENRS